MRRFSAIMVTSLVAGLLWLAGPAAANGGAYFELDRTYFVQGSPATAESYVTIPEHKLGLLEQGPFYGYLLPAGIELKEDRAIPPEAVRIGTFTVAKERGWYEFALRFTTPSLGTGGYTLQLCNDPCTISGFAEPVSGFMTIVSTPYEAQLLKQQQVFLAKINRAERELKRTEATLDEMSRSLDASNAARATSAATTEELRTQLDELRTAPPPRPFVEPWAAVLVAFGLMLLALALLRRRRANSSTEVHGADDRQEGSRAVEFEVPEGAGAARR